MWLLALEAFGAFFLFAFIVWWTMFAGKKPANKEITAPSAKKNSEADSESIVKPLPTQD
jgi:hypothetical protein